MAALDGRGPAPHDRPRRLHGSRQDPRREGRGGGAGRARHRRRRRDRARARRAAGRGLRARGRGSLPRGRGADRAAALDGGGIVALGGGAVESERVREALAAASPSGAGSPRRLPGSDARAPSGRWRRTAAEFSRRFAARQPLYESVADAILTDGGERVGRLAAPWLRAAAALDGARLAWAASASGEYPAIVAREHSA